MNPSRRRFLKTVLALAAAPAVARVQPLAIAEEVTERVFLGVDPAVASGDRFIAFIHPAMWRDIRELAGRGRWEQAWRRYRLALKAGDCEPMDSPAVLDRFADPPPKFNDDGIGRYQGVRFITAREFYKPPDLVEPPAPPPPSSLTLNMIERAVRSLRAEGVIA